MELVNGLGYQVTDIEAELGPEMYEKFVLWFVGQTGAVSRRGEYLVYPDDYAKFLRRIEGSK